MVRIPTPPLTAPLRRSKDGLISYFGDYDVTKITTGMIREYLLHLDQNRAKPLAESTKSKHIVIIRKVLTLAVEDGLMHTLPPMPKVKTVDIAVLNNVKDCGPN